jgi:hypothetical protein
MTLENNFLVNRIVPVWNSSPDYVVFADTVNSCKKRLDKHWLSQGIKYNWKAKMLEMGN